MTLQAQRKNKQCPRQEESQVDVTILVWPTLVKSKAELGDRACLERSVCGNKFIHSTNTQNS